MKAKTYLQEIKKLDIKIENKQMEVGTLYSLIKQISVPMKEINIQSSGDNDRLGSTIARIVDLKEEINKEIDRYVDRKLEAIKLINELENDEYITILIKRYIKYEEWQTIADDLHYSRQSIDKKHGVALLEFQKILDSIEN